MRPADEQGGKDEGGEEEVDDGNVDDHPVVIVDESAETSNVVRMGKEPGKRTWGLYYKSFYCRNLRVFVIS
jgi:hypothetical protein